MRTLIDSGAAVLILYISITDRDMCTILCCPGWLPGHSEDFDRQWCYGANIVYICYRPGHVHCSLLPRVASWT